VPSLSFQPSGAPRDLHSFPTRRSSDLLEMTDLPVPRAEPGEVLVRVAACGICGSDVHGYDGSSGRRIPPIVMGHEAAGRNAAIRSEEHTSELQSRGHLVCRLLLEKKNN